MDINWLINSPVTMVVLGIVIISLGFLIYRNKKGLLQKAALYAVSKAEEAWGSDTGRIKFAEVYTYLSKQYPVITFFFTEEQLSDIIETALTEMKIILGTKEAKSKMQCNN